MLSFGSLISRSTLSLHDPLASRLKLFLTPVTVSLLRVLETFGIAASFLFILPSYFRTHKRGSTTVTPHGYHAGKPHFV